MTAIHRGGNGIDRRTAAGLDHADDRKAAIRENAALLMLQSGKDSEARARLSLIDRTPFVGRVDNLEAGQDLRRYGERIRSRMTKSSPERRQAAAERPIAEHVEREAGHHQNAAAKLDQAQRFAEHERGRDHANNRHQKRERGDGRR
jgi:hypothetical protein